MKCFNRGFAARVAVSALILALAGGCATAPIRTAIEKPAAEPAWHMDGGDARRQSTATYAVAEKWSDRHEVLEMVRPAREVKSGESATPLVIGDALVMGSSDGVVLAYDLVEGYELWRFKLDGRLISSPAYMDGYIFAADDLGVVYSIGLDGKESWRYEVERAVNAPITVDGGRLYVLTADQNLYCIDAALGRALWRYEEKVVRDGTIWRASAPAVADDVVYIGLGEGNVVALDTGFGRILWKKRISSAGFFPDVTAGPALDGDVLYAGSHQGPVVALAVSSGDVVWEKPYRALGGIAVDSRHIYFGTPTGKVFALNKADGEKAWEATLDRGVATAPVVVAGRLLVGASEGSIHLIDCADGKVLNTWSPGSGIQSNPFASPHGAGFISNTGVVHFIEGGH